MFQEKQNKKKISVFNIIINIIIILLAILVIYWFIKLIFGGSPRLDEFNFAIIILLGSFLIKLYREIGEVKVGLKHSFKNIKEDISLLKGDMNSIKDDTNLIKKKLKV